MVYNDPQACRTVFLPSRVQNDAEFLIYESEKKDFRPRLKDIVSSTHRLVRLAKVIDWDRELGHLFAMVGAAALPTRLMTGLMYLQHKHIVIIDYKIRFKPRFLF